MQIFRHYTDIPDAWRGAAVAIGNFDGVHRGHQALIARTRELAEALRIQTATLVFEPHPQEFFRPGAEHFRLTPFHIKARLLAEAGVDAMYALAFNADMATRTAEEFVRDVLVNGLHVRAIVIGRDFRFGKGRTGDVELLSRMASQCGFAVEIFEPVLVDGMQKISSTEIRDALRAGRPEEAKRLLGRWWAIEGRVERGDGRGRILGFPTANMSLDGYVRPAFGIYAVRATVFDDNEPRGSHLGVASVGVRPMFRADQPLAETFLFDFSGDLYGKHLTVELLAYLRAEKAFESINDLKAQMTVDCDNARKISAMLANETAAEPERRSR